MVRGDMSRSKRICKEIRERRVGERICGESVA